MSFRILSAFSLPLFSLVLCAGCGESVDRPQTIAVTGTVVYQSKPVEGAEVSFWGEGAPRAATGVTDAEGKFMLSMFEFNDGCLPGRNTITIRKMEAGAENAAVSEEDMLSDPLALASAASAQDSGQGPKSLIPEKYSDRKASGLSEDVSADNNTFVFNLAD